MPLFNDLVGFSTTSLLDMTEIVRCDGGFGDAAVAGDPTVRQFTYGPTAGGTSQTRIAALVGIGSNIVVGAVGAGFVLSDGTPITAVAGVTQFPDAAGVIRILYDVDSSYFVFASDGSQISFPRTVCLYHELAHAFHIANGTLNTANPEFQAETDENGFRTQVGLVLRDPNNHAGGLGGGNGQSVPSCSGAPTTSGGCLVATAAEGSPEAPGVVRLKSARDAFMARSPVFGAIAGQTLAEYYGFSPFIALDMQRDPALRAAVNAWFVRPLSHFDGILAAFIASNADVPATIRVLAPRIRAWEGATPHLPAVATAAAALAERLATGARGGRGEAPADPTPEAVFAYVADRVLWAGPAPGIAWMSHLLRIYWRVAAAGPEPDEETVARLAAAAGDWIASAPIPPQVLDLPAALLEAELVRLGASVFRSGPVRARVAARLLAAAEASPVDDARRIGRSLARTGYVALQSEG